MREKIIELAKKNGADIIGFTPVSRFDKNDPIFRIMPETKTVIGMAFRVLRGIYRGVEEGTTYYQYTTMGVENMEETIMPMAQLKVANLIEAEGFIALPQRRHQQIMAEENSTNPEVAHDAIYRGKTAEVQMNFLDAAVKCGLGEKSFHGSLLTDEFGPMVRWCFVLTDAELEESPVIEPHLCDNCGKCASACPGKAIGKDGKVEPWQCAVYYNGANGTKNPFMPPDAFPGMEDLVRRLKLAGYSVYLLSNASRSQPSYWQEVPASRLFDGTLISYELGVVKPMHEIYEAFTEKFALQPDECVFIDDASINVAGAVACGWHGIVFHGDSEELARKLSDMGVHPSNG